MTRLAHKCHCKHSGCNPCNHDAPEVSCRRWAKAEYLPAHNELDLCVRQIRSCMNITCRDRVLIIGDNRSQRISSAIFTQLFNHPADILLLNMDDFGPRPFTSMPKAMDCRITEFNPTVSIYTSSKVEGETPFRVALTKEHICHGKIKTRHAHMPSVTEEMLLSAFSGDQREVHELTMQLKGLLKRAKSMRVTSSAGTDLEITLNPKKLKWVSDTPFIRKQGKMSNLPAGEVFTCPWDVNGTLVVDGVLGADFGKYGFLNRTPAIIEIEKSRAVEVACANWDLAKHLKQFFGEGDVNCNRVGEVAIGTNIFIRKLLGSMLHDEKFPSFHLAFGEPCGPDTGADWESKDHLDGIVLAPTISAELEDGAEVLLMEKGRLQQQLIEAMVLSPRLEGEAAIND